MRNQAIWLCIVLASYVGRPASAQEDVRNLLRESTLPPYKWFASTDPKRQNQDYLLLKPGETRRIPLAAGNLLRLWSTAFKPDKIVLALQNGKRTDLLRDGRAKYGQFYQKAFTFYPELHDPLAVRNLRPDATLIVSNWDGEANKFYYQVTVRDFAVARKIASVGSGAGLRPETIRWTLQPDQEEPVFKTSAAATPNGDIEQPNTLESITLDPAAATVQTWRNLRLRVRWSSPNETHVVDVPLWDFKARFLKGHRVGTEMHTLEDISLSFPPLPPGKMRDVWPRVMLVNSGRSPVQVSIRVRHDEGYTTRQNSYHLWVAFGSARSEKGKPISMLRVNGQGAFVGLALSIAPAADSGRRTFAYLEGNEIITADGVKYEGTGTEDFFNSAWYFPADNKPFVQPYHGMTFKTELPPRVSAYRLMIPDAVPFKKSLNFDFEHGRLNNSNDLEYRWVAFWYQKPPLKFEVTDALGSGTEAAPQEGASGLPAAQDSLWKRVGLLALGGVLFVLVVRFATRLVRGSSPH